MFLIILRKEKYKIIDITKNEEKNNEARNNNRGLCSKELS